MQKQLNVPELKLIQDVVTRWNSTYLIFELIVNQHNSITTTLCLLDKASLCLSSEEKDIITQSLRLLKPSLEATEDISGDMYVAISLIIPLTKMVLKTVSSGPSVPLQPLFQREIQRRFSKLEHHFTLVVSTLLNHGFKNLIFSDMAAVDKTVRRLKEDVLNLIYESENHTSENEDDTTLPHSPPTIPQPSSTSSSLWSGFDKTVLRATLHCINTTDGFI